MPPTPLQPGESVGPYTLIAPIASVGDTIVWRARHGALGCERTLEIPPDPQEDRCLCLEETLQARLRHPALVQAVDLLHHQGRAVLVLELARESDLTTGLPAQGPVAAADSVTILLRLSEGVACLHAEEVVHRELSAQDELPEALKPVIRRCMSVEPDGRHPDVGALCEALGRLQLADEEPELELDDDDDEDEATEVFIHAHPAPRLGVQVATIPPRTPPRRRLGASPPRALTPEPSPPWPSPRQTRLWAGLSALMTFTAVFAVVVALLITR
jgi:hypothetical protein